MIESSQTYAQQQQLQNSKPNSQITISTTFENASKILPEPQTTRLKAGIDHFCQLAPSKRKGQNFFFIFF